MEDDIRELTIEALDEFERAEYERLNLKSFNLDFKKYEMPENYIKIAEFPEFAFSNMNSRIDITDGISDRNYVVFFKYPYIYVSKNDIEYDLDRIRYLVNETFRPANMLDINL